MLMHAYFLFLKMLEKIDSGYRLPPPPGCPRTIYRVMIKCWYVRKHACILSQNCRLGPLCILELKQILDSLAYSLGCITI